MAEIQPNARDVFFSQKNEGMLQRLLKSDFQRRIGGELNEKQTTRLGKTVNHYMAEVYENEANSGKSIQDLNKEVLQAVVPDYLSYLRRQSQPRPTERAEMERIQTDVSSRFDMMQQERQSGRGAPPNPPNFQLALEDENAPPSVARFEELKRQRELEAKRIEADAAALMNKPLPEDMARRIQSDDMFRTSSREAQQADQNLLAIRDSQRQSMLDSTRNQILDVPPDGRAILFGEQGAFPPITGPRASGIPNANPTYSLPEAIRTRPPLPQDNIKSQQDVVTYKENEYNLFIYSADRDWVNNTNENRYNFSVNFDPANNRSGFGLSPAANIKFKNISRIELVKVIMATEACDTLSLKTTSSAYDTSKYVNVFAYPYLQVRIDELNTNGYGTNDGLNNSFGVISYDAYWASDSALNNRGFTRMIPKFLKCQKVFYPTPLATLNRLTIQIQKPDGSVFCDSADALDVSGAVLSSMINLTSASSNWMGATGGGITVTNTNYYDNTGTGNTGEYIWIQTKTWFSRFAVTQGDRVVLKNLVYPSTFGGVNTQAATEFLNFLTRAEGHIVVDIGQLTITGTGGSRAATFASGSTFGSNKLGYSNFIIIRNRFADPTTGSTAPADLGSTFNGFLGTTTGGSGPGLSTGRVLNTSHQLQLIFRVITRDMDSATRLRPDNL